MEGEVKISLNDFLNLQDKALEGEKKVQEIVKQASIFKQEASLLLNFIAKKHDIGIIVAEFNKQSKRCFIKMEDGELEMQIMV